MTATENRHRVARERGAPTRVVELAVFCHRGHELERRDGKTRCPSCERLSRKRRWAEKRT